MITYKYKCIAHTRLKEYWLKKARGSVPGEMKLGSGFRSKILLSREATWLDYNLTSFSSDLKDLSGKKEEEGHLNALVG